MPAPLALPRASSSGPRPANRKTWLVAAATVLILVGISSVLVAAILTRPNGNGSPTANLPSGHLTPLQIAAALEGRKFTRDVVPPALADSAALRDVFMPGSVPGLIGQVSTTTSDLGGTVTIYVFADPVWAQAFFETPPMAYGCGVCTSMEDPTSVQGVGDKATSFVLYRKQVGGKSWVATTTYVLRGSVVVNGLYFPVNVSSASPSALDLAVPTAYARAGLQLIDKI